MRVSIATGEDLNKHLRRIEIGHPLLPSRGVRGVKKSQQPLPDY